MIVDALVKFFSSLFAGLLSWLPAVPAAPAAALSAALHTLESWWGALIQPLNFYLPVYTWLRLFVIIFVAEVAYSVWSGISWLIGVIRGSGNG